MDDYYSAPESGASPGDAGEGKPSKPQGGDEGDEMDGDTAIVSKSVFKGKIPEVGQECRFKVEHIFEKEVELSWVDKGDGEKKPSKEKSSTMDNVNDAFDKMSGPSETEE
jgi:hypothetical protein